MVINVSLFLVAVLLLLNLFEAKFPSFGQAKYLLDEEAPLCGVKWKSTYTQWNDLDNCCLESRKQLDCEKEIRQVDFGRVDWKCFTGNSDSVVSYVLNNKAYNYCRRLSFW